MNIPQELLYQQYVRRELETYRAPYDPEAEFYSYVRQGNTEKVKELCRESFQEEQHLISNICCRPVCLQLLLNTQEQRSMRRKWKSRLKERVFLDLVNL